MIIMVRHYKMYIGGKWVNAASGRRMKIINPATEKIIATVPEGGKQDAEAAVNAGRKAFDSGWEAAPAERASILWKLADLVEKNISRLARLESMNQGKTIKYSLESDFPFLIDNLRFFAGAARNLEGKAAAEYTGLGTSILRREPVGVVASIVPWNYPLYIAIWKIAPALAAGNALVIKPASYTPLTLLEFAKLAEKLLPKGILNVVTGPGETLGSELASNKKVDMISFTGDTSTGKKIMQLASSNAKRVHLELGGKAPFIVFEDADLEAAAEGAIVGGFFNSGQDCTAATRIYVHRSIHDAFVKKLISKAKKIRLGNQLDRKTDMGPLVSARHRERVESYVQSGMKEGANLVFGGKRLNGKGYFFQPTIFAGVRQEMRICQEEIFGPVLSVIKFSTVSEAVEKANSVIYGLAASVWTSDVKNAFRIANKLRFGTVWINEHGVLASEMPHGGYKQSGTGKDLSMYAFEEYTQVKHIYVDLTEGSRKPWYYTVYGKK
ncbi:MAG: aminobutyraldehyde dehydrogenase [Candidatus Aenigmarchaeota archaeon]|nr:aminobutyraldehyde dehydrogenase [Candidatus Aenigmarchaeota archaeon]